MRNRGTTVFHEEQRLSQRRTQLLTAIPPVAMLLLAIWQVGLGHPWGKHPLSNGNVIGWTIFLWLIYLRLMTVKLVTEVGPEDLFVAMRGLWRAQRIPWSSVQSARPVTFDPVRDWGGYGIRSTGKGKAYIASGTEGAQLELSGGSVLLVGSKRAAELVRAINQRRQ